MHVVRLLGPVDVVDSTGTVHSPGSPIRATLLALLGLEAGRAVEAERLLDLAWDFDPPSSGLRALRFHISKLRTELGVDGLILTLGSAYRIDATSDVDEVEAALARPHLLPFEGLVALSRWRGDAFSGTRACTALEHEQLRLQELRLELVERRCHALLAEDEAAAVISEVSGLCLEHPLREGLWSTLITAHYRMGSQAEALRCYDRIRTALIETSGIDPSPGLRQLYDDVLKQHERLDPPSERPSAVATADGPDHRAPPAPRSAKRPPVGVVTILFTDVEGSMELWATDTDGMTASIRRHDEIVESVMEEFGGYIFTRTEESFYVAFQSVRDGIAAAAAAQTRLSEATWPGPNLTVRMGLHLGEADWRDGSFFGPVVNTAALVGAASHGGQVVCTDATRLAADAPATDLGVHRLKDVPIPIQLWQLGSGSFPALQTLAGRSNLPSPPSQLFGRDRDVASVQELLANGRLVTLTAVGGAGKTRLAIAVGAAERSAWPHGIWFVDLTEVSSDGDVAVLVASIIGLELGPGDAVSRIAEHLARVPQLIILDNCEHLLDGCAELAGAILSAGGNSKLLATSREWIGVDGEQVYRVPSLGSATDEHGRSGAAVLLFVDRARSVDPSFRLTAGNRSAVEEVCERLDGVPLAIELAAARSTVWSPAELVTGLDNRFHLLSGTRRRQRRRTLKSTIDWSYDLLEAEEQRSFSCIGVFPGDFDLRAAAAVMNTSLTDASDVIESLLSKSLVSASPVGPMRFRLLETLKAYAEDRLAQAQEAETVRERHALHFLGRAVPESMIAADDLRRVVQLEPEFANLEAAAAWFLHAKRWSELANLLHSPVSTWLPDGAIGGRLDLIERCRAEVDDPHIHAILDVSEIRWSLTQGDWTRFRRVVKTLVRSADAEGQALGHFYRAMQYARTDPAAAEAAMDQYVSSTPESLRHRARVVANAGTLMTALQRNDAGMVRGLAFDVAAEFEALDFLPYQWAAARASIGVLGWIDGDVEAPARVVDQIVDCLGAERTQAFEQSNDFLRTVSVISTGPTASAVEAVKSHCLDLVGGRHLSVDSSGLALLAELARSEGDHRTARTLMRSWTLARSPDFAFFGRHLARLLGVDAEIEANYRAHRGEPGWINDRPKQAIEAELKRRGWIEV